MQKILLILCAILTTTSVHATQMCARRDTTVIPLDASVNAAKDNYAGYPSEWTWLTHFSYGSVYGISTCLSLPEIQEYSTSGDISILSTDIDELQGRSGDYVAPDDTTYPRIYCYGRLTHPMSSLWLLTEGTVAKTSAECEKYCPSSAGTKGVGLVYNNIPIRSKLFNTIGQAPGYIDINTNEYDQSINLN